MESVIITAKDGYPLSARVFYPEKSNGKILLVNSATGVRQQIYFSFAYFFAEHGFTVITYDYRGIGESKPKKMKGFDSSMKIWGSVDYKAVTDYIQQYFKSYEKFCLGHSVGALILGMNPDSKIFKEFIFVATQKSYWGNLRLKTKVEALLGFGIVLPIVTKILGYLPSEKFGLGESLPTGNAKDWRTLLLHRKSTNKVLEGTENYSQDLKNKVFFLYMEDDFWVTKEGVRKLMHETYPNMKPKYRKVRVSESESGKVGHINFFRSYNKKLWNIILDEIQNS